MKRHRTRRDNPAGPGAASQTELAAKLDRALALHRAGSFKDALALYIEAARAMPGNHRLWLAVEAVAVELGDLERAGRALKMAAALLPGDMVTWVNHSGAALRGGDKPTAEGAARRALTIAPLNMTARNNLARSLRDTGRPDALARASERAAIIQPGDPIALMARVLWSAETDQPATVVRAARRGLCALPGDRTFLSNLGSALTKLRRRDDAWQTYRRALITAPGFAPAWYNLGNYFDQGANTANAIRAYDRATLLAPDNADYQFNRALSLLLVERYAEGFEGFEHRWGSAAQTTAWREPGRAAWDGRPLKGQSVLVWAEQGLGDTLQFSRYLQFIRDQGGVPWLEAQPELTPLLRLCPAAERVYARGQEMPPVADFHVPLMSLPKLAKSTPDIVPPPVPFPRLPPPSAVGEAGRSINIGLVWAGNPKHHRDLERSIPLRAFAPLAKLTGLCLHIVQHGAARDQIETCGFEDRLVQHAPTADFLEAASLIRAMDLLITVDTAQAHLAGTLGVETWVLLSHVPDWRWSLHRSDSIWYPSVRLYRQDGRASWAPVITEIAKDLSRYRVST